MNDALQGLIEVSHFFGKDKSYVIAGGGNTSYKDNKHIYIKASGKELGKITESDFVTLDRNTLIKIITKIYSSNHVQRDIEVKRDLMMCSISPSDGMSPSIESLIHGMIDYKYVVHTHPVVINALACSLKGRQVAEKLLGKKIMYVDYADPGYDSAKNVEDGIIKYKKLHGVDPKIIILSNHGVFVSADTIDEVKKLYREMVVKVEQNFKKKLKVEDLPVNDKSSKVLSTLGKLLYNDNIKVVRIRNNTLIESFTRSKNTYKLIERPLTPDNIVYCRARNLFIEEKGTPDMIIKVIEKKLKTFREKYRYDPRIILISGLGMIGISDSVRKVEEVLDIFECVMKIAFYAKSFGGPKYLTAKDSKLISESISGNY